MAKQKLVAKYEKFDSRIAYKGDLAAVYNSVCKDFGIGNFKSGKIIEQGFEDLNVRLTTTKGEYFLKLFAKSRKKGEGKRIVDIALRLHHFGINTPKLYKSKNGYLDTIGVGGAKTPACLMQFVPGKSLFARRSSPTTGDMKVLAKEAAKINSTGIVPSEFIPDSWSVLNFPQIFKERGGYLSPDDKKLIKPLTDIYPKLRMDKLPHAFVHGDIVSTNVIKDAAKKLWIVDFSVSNWYPRIIELAVFAGDILLDATSKNKTQKNIDMAL